ncbi:MAG: hypothetical protein WAM14_07710, partial [Candidatus Nitrosopolaris sp.]
GYPSTLTSNLEDGAKMTFAMTLDLIMYVHFVTALKNLHLHQEVLLKIIFVDVIQLMGKIVLGEESMSS